MCIRDRIEMLKTAFTMMGIEPIQCDGFEADDIISHIVHHVKKPAEVLVVSPDKDLMQLVGNKTRIYNTRSKAFISAPEVQRMTGLPPVLIPAFLAIMGDAADNIHGVPGIGKTRAARALNAYGSLKQLLAGVKAKEPKKIPDKEAHAIDEHRILILQNLRLTRLKKSVPLKILPYKYPASKMSPKKIDAAISALVD